MTDLNRLLKTQDFKNEAELRAFLDSMIGQTVPEFEPEALSVEEKAEDLVFAAYELSDDEAFSNVLDALNIDPDCIAAYEYLGSMQPVPQLALPYYAYAIQLGREKFAKELREDRGHFWGITETRPFMRCLNNYASCFASIGQAERSLDIYKEIIELNEQDSMGVRFPYGLFLLRAGMFDEFTQLDSEFGMESTSMSVFNRVLYNFLTKGVVPETLNLLKKAKTLNKYIIPVLTAKTASDHLPDSYALGSKDEALIYSDFAFDVWHELDGARAFLIKNKK